MRLNKIKLAGFKSFVDPTTIPLVGNLAAVVGPNGCGKSNVIDAVRWVMGESSAKKLRGGELADVIFNGSTSRKPLGQASVELEFDNSDGGLGGEYASYAEISIRRLVTREGQSHYFLNGTKCRRRDITDIFLGTGLGPRSYAIIEQGTISRVIEAKPEDLRVFIDEAAGISKYKERRKETENRIHHTRENLERLKDLRDELERQLKNLQRQAHDAEKFSNLKSEERLLSAQLAAFCWSKLDEDIQQIEHMIRHTSTELEQVQATRQSVETEIEVKREEQHDASELLNQVQARFYNIGNEISRIEQTLKHHNERKQALSEDARIAERELEEAQQNLQADQLKIDQLQLEIESVTPLFEQIKEEVSQATIMLSEHEDALETWRDTWQETQRLSEQSTRLAEVEKTKISQLDKQMTQSRAREDKLQEEQERLLNTQQADDLTTLEQVIEEAGELVETLDSQLSDCQSLKRQAGDELQETKRLLREAEKALQKDESRLTALEALQNAKQEGNSDLNRWIEHLGIKDNRKLYQNLECEPEWSMALETVLGDKLESVLIDSDQISDIALGASSLVSGSFDAVFISVKSSAVSAARFTTLVSKISNPTEQVQSLLEGIYIASSTQVALEQMDQLAPSESFITQEGLWLSASWMRVNKKAKDQQESIIERERDIKALKELIHTALNQVDHLKSEVTEKEAFLEHSDEQRDTLQFSRNQAYKQLTESKAQLSTQKERAAHLSERTQQIALELNDINQSVLKWQDEIDVSRELVSQAIDEMAQFSDSKYELELQKEVYTQGVAQAKAQLQSLKTKEHECALRSKQMTTELQATQNNIVRFVKQISNILERKAQITLQQEQHEQPVDGLHVELEAFFEQRLEIEEQLSVARDGVNDLENRLRELERSRSQFEGEVNHKRDRLEQAKMSWQAMIVKRENALEKLSSGEFELKTLIEQMPEDANEEVWQKRLITIENQVSRLGAINLAAIDEYASQNERKMYLDSQDEDLSEALKTLEGAIAKIDRETRLRFKDTFDKVNANFQILFPKLFGGGHASLAMVGDEILDAGITVMARPPGKKNTTIHLLSGGEKALTAVSLVFSIFQLNPAPFCMLDEVDAPLDDYNVGRFCHLVKEMSKTVQFIYISHNKLALEMADQLQGVTMKEPGVSRIVTVDVEEARSLAEA